MKVKRKVLFFLNNFQIGGCHLQMTYLIRELKAGDFEPVICTHISDGGGLRALYHDLGVRIYNLSRKHKLDVSILRKLKRVIVLEKIDIIVLFIPQNFIYYTLIKRFIGKDIHQVGLLRAMGFWLGHRNKAFKVLDDYLSAKFIHSCDVVIANSIAIKKRYDRDFSLDPEKIKVYYNFSEFRFTINKTKEEVRNELEIQPNDVVVIMVARLDPWKDFDTLLKAAEVLQTKSQSFKFLLCGGGQLEGSIREKIQQRSLSRSVMLLGEQKNVHNFLNAADISVLTTKGEGFSNAIMESMALAKPVVATNVGGNSELIGRDDQCGFLVEENDFTRLSDLLLQLGNNEPLREQIGARASQRIRSLCGRENLLAVVNEFKSL